MEKENSIYALITAAGSSTRMGGIKKEFIRYQGKPLICHALKPFLKTDIFSKIYLTCNPEMTDIFSDTLGDNSLVSIVKGGKTRQESVFLGLEAMRNECPEIVLIHDGARPFVSEKIIMEVAVNTRKYGACAPVIPLVDSVKVVNNSFIEAHPERTSMKAIQTPQGFRFRDIYDSHVRAKTIEREFNDDTEIYSMFAGNVYTVPGALENLKITYTDDLKKAGFVMDDFRTGQGYDIHRLEPGKKLVIGGVNIVSDRGAVAHSDGDVLYHAIIDSLLGAAAERDIGYHFPPSDKRFKNIDSAILLEKTGDILKAKGFQINNIDATVILQEPKLSPHIGQIRQNIAQILGIGKEQVSVKAKTKELCDSTGEGKAVESFSSVLIKRAAG